jgi:uncharacterized protein YcaQ
MGPITVSREEVVRLWLHRQGLATPRGAAKLTKRRLSTFLEDTGALQLDSVNVVDRAHYLTLWSRFGTYDRAKVDRWIYDEQVGYEFWGHEASILPISHFPLGLREMRRFPPKRWVDASWWKLFDVPTPVKRHVMKRLRDEGPLESADFERGRDESKVKGSAWASPLPKESKPALRMLWHAGKIAVRTRRHFRRVYDVAERVYPDVAAAASSAVDDHWLLQGLRGNGIASEKHLVHYFSAPQMAAADRKRVIARNLRKRAVVQVDVEGQRGTFYALPEHLERLSRLPEPRGTHLLSPFDSFLWQRQRAEDLLGFRYRVEIYMPPKRREYGYYVLPILHDGRPVGRLDPKLHRDRNLLEIKSLKLEPDFDVDAEAGSAFLDGLRESLESLAEFLGAGDLRLPRGWKKKLG